MTLRDVTRDKVSASQDTQYLLIHSLVITLSLSLSLLSFFSRENTGHLALYLYPLLR